jgi:putative FmdB family regulatory protein
MPNYDYTCTQCGHTFTAFQSMSAAPLETCPNCNGRVKRLIGGGMGLIFKGTGFYATDYKNSSCSVSDSSKSSKSSGSCAACPNNNSCSGSADD